MRDGQESAIMTTAMIRKSIHQLGLYYRSEWLVTSLVRGKMAFKRWMYRGGRPNILAKIQNRGWAILHSLGVFPDRFVTLEVVGRKSGKIVSFPLAMTVMNGERYLVSMLGEETN